MFAAGDTVRVKDAWPEARGPVHIRTPHYVRGVTGEVVRHLGDFANPEDLAFRRPAASARCTCPVPQGRDLAGGEAGRRIADRNLRALAGAAMNVLKRMASACWRRCGGCWTRRELFLRRKSQERIASPMPPVPARARGWWRGPGSIRIIAADAGGRHKGGRGDRHPDARHAAAGGAGEYAGACIIWWSARCAVAIRGRCWGIRRSGTNRRPSGRGRCAIRGGCWRRSGRRSLRMTVKVRVVDSTADYRWMVLPMRPAGHRGVGRGAAGGDRARGRHDRGDGAGGLRGAGPVLGSCCVLC